MAGILNLIIGCITPKGVVRRRLPRPERAFSAPGYIFAMPRLGASFGSEQVIVAIALEEMGALGDA
jgi:hypothetical protein